MSGVLITNNADTHHPLDWAVATAQMIVSVDPNTPTEKRISGLRLQASIAEALESHYAAVQQQETAALEADAAGRYHAPHEPGENLDRAIAAIKDSIAGSPWEKDVSDPAMIEQIRQIVGNHMASIQHVHRQAHARQSPEPVAQEFIAKLHSGFTPDEAAT